MGTQLIPVVTSEIGSQTVQAVDGRTLHAFLEVKSQFRDWISNRIEEYGFESGKDFRDFFSESTGGRPTVICQLTLTSVTALESLLRQNRIMICAPSSAPGARRKAPVYVAVSQ